MDTVEHGSDGRGSPLAGVAAAQILARLDEAAALARGGLAGRSGKLHALLLELADRAAALELAEAAVDRPPEQAGTCLSRALVASGAGEPPGEFLLIPFGQVGVERAGGAESFEFTRAHAESAQRWFERIGRKLAIDYEHQSYERFNTRADGLRPAAGWIGGLEIRDDGLWAVDVTWTPRAQELLRSGEYRYFSPVIFWTDARHSDVAALGPVALTNDPALRGAPALAASRAALDERPESADPDEPVEEAPASEGGAPAELAEAQAEVALLRRELAARAADAFVARGLRAGKIVESSSADWREDYERDAARAEQRLARAPVLLPPGRLVPRDGRGQALGRQAGPRADTMGENRRGQVEPEDLAAYERAAAAGRILRGGAG